jgi:hypothetical protein
MLKEEIEKFLNEVITVERVTCAMGIQTGCQSKDLFQTSQTIRKIAYKRETIPAMLKL